MKTQDLPHQQACAEWSNRILILSLLGIAYLTLFPFRFNFSPTYIFHRYPFLLETSVKKPAYSDFFLNVLLFVPFGFGLSAQARKRGKTRKTLFLLALAVGAALSYTVELVQFYIPARDSGWEDVLSNTTGSVAGFILFDLWGSNALKKLSKWEDSFGGWLTPRRASLLLAIYFALSFGNSVLLQSETRLSNWDPQCILFVGNDASGRYPWRGQVFLLQIWNRALPEQVIRRMAGGESTEDANAGLLGSYDFASSPPYQDQRNFLPALRWTPEQPHLTAARGVKLDERSWLSTNVPSEKLTQEIRKSSQFTIHIICAQAATDESDGRVVSLSKSDDDVNFHLRQERQFLVFWFRNPLSAKGSLLAWYIPGVFGPGKIRDIVATYDGADAFIYLDGNRWPQAYHLSPGATLMHSSFYIETASLQGYVIVYETLVFLPAGLLIGVEVEKWSRQNNSGRWVLVLGWAVPALLLEILLAKVSGRRIWAGNIAFSLFFGLAGILLINADRRLKNCSGAP
jgi:glycopeptide antibiotics resistance protein